MAVVKATNDAIAGAAAALAEGRLVAFPTETVYGLGADATNGAAVAKIFAAKGRPRFNPLISHVADLDAADKLALFDERARLLAAAFWPGPLTMVAQRRPGCPVSDLVTAGLDTLAVRVPAHPVARALLSRVGRPIAAPSANRSGHVSPTTAGHVAADLNDAPAMILDAGPCAHGIESTVIDVSGPRVTLLRPGSITSAQIVRVLGYSPELSSSDAERPSAPGQLASHYAPRARVRLGATTVSAGEALLAFGSSPPATSGPMINLSAHADLIEAAAGLFAALRTLDATNVSCIAVMPIPETGLGEAINDRLRRAAAGR